MSSASVSLKTAFELNVGSPIGQFRAAPVCLGPDGPHAMIAAYAADFDVDPYVEMFFFPTDTLKLVLFDLKGKILWKRDLGPAVVPGMWFVPVLPFDLDGDGCDEIFYVGNTDPQHPLGVSKYVLERLDARTGEVTGQWPWPRYGGEQTLSSQFRNFLMGARVYDEPVLVTAQGTYGAMFLQGWRPGMQARWDHRIAADSPGARGSHMCPVVDINHDGVDELMWGERCIELDKGTELFCADRDVYRGHSDVIQPLFDRASGRWFVYTIREGDPEATPRVVLFDDQGRRVWGAVDKGHMDMGWVARRGPEARFIAMAIRIGHKTCGPDGRFHEGRTEFVFDAMTGRPVDPGFSVYQTKPVDLNGDGRHEFVRGIPGGDGEVIDENGVILGSVGGPVALTGKFLDRPGEQVLVYHPDGAVRAWYDANAEDRPQALERYSSRFYQTNLRHMSTGSNPSVLAGA